MNARCCVDAMVEALGLVERKVGVKRGRRVIMVRMSEEK